VKVLVLTRWAPDDCCGGAALRSTQNIRALTTLASVDVVSVGVDGPTRTIAGVGEWTPFAAGTPSFLRRTYRKMWPLRRGAHPITDAYWSPRVSQWLRRRIVDRRYDAVVLENIVLEPYLADLRKARCRILLDAHNVEAAVYASVFAARAAAARTLLHRAKHRWLYRRLVRLEGRLLRAADVIWACSHQDAEELARRYQPRGRMCVVPNGVETNAYRLIGSPALGDDWGSGPMTILYPGLFGYPPNEDAALSLITRVLPAIRASGRRARLVLVGRGPTDAMRAAACGDADVEITGEVESILPFLDRPCVMVLPIRLGGGTRLKIVEAFAAGRPVVSTSKGAEGLHALDGRHLLIRDDLDGMAAAAIQLWDSPGLRTALCGRALQLVCRRYSWEAATRSIARSLDLAAETGRPVERARPALRMTTPGATRAGRA
jgi:glycosyltransferase involved in cell wall biosynthesis